MCLASTTPPAAAGGTCLREEGTCMPLIRLQPPSSPSQPGEATAVCQASYKACLECTSTRQTLCRGELDEQRQFGGTVAG